MLDLLIVVPCYNYGKYINECIDSILLNKTSLKYKIVIVDDCSTDDSWEIIKNIKNKRIRAIRLDKNSKTSVARNTGIKLYKSNLVLCIDADDKIPSNYIQELYYTIKNYNVDVAYCKSRCFGDINCVHDFPEFNEKEFIKGNFVNCSAMFKRYVWDKINGYDETMLFGFEDYDFWLSAVEKRFKFKKCKTTELLWRIKSQSRDISSQEHKDVIYKYIKEKHKDFWRNNEI